MTPSPSSLSDRSLNALGYVLGLGAVISLLDATIVNVGIGSIRADLGASLSSAQWFATGYLLSLALVMPTSGWAADRFGARRVWMSAVALFVAGSVACGLAWSPTSLIVLRIAQGIGGGLIQPVGQALLVRTAGRERAARIFGIVVVPVTLAPALGPVIGGAILSVLSWRWLFFVNLPIGVLTLLLAARVVPRAEPQPARPLDRRGLALLSPGLGAIVFGLSQAGAEHGFAHPVVAAPLIAGALLIGAYVVHALRDAGEPLIDVRLFARRSFATASATAFALGASLYSAMFLLPLLAEQVRHADTIQAGLFLFPQGAGTAAAALVAGRLSRLAGVRARSVAGVLLAIAGTLMLTGVGAGSSWLPAAAGLALRGFGIGMGMTALIAAVYQDVPEDRVQRATSAYNVLNRVGGSLGTAVLTLVLQDRLRGGAPVAHAFSGTLWWAVALSAAALVPTLALPAAAPGARARGRAKRRAVRA